MNAVEIEEAVSALAAEPFDAEAFPWAFLQAFGNKETTIKRLRSGQSNASDVAGGVLQRNNIHLAVAPAGEAAATLAALRDSAKTGAARVKFILSTDGETLEAEELVSGEPLACAYADLAQAFGFFLPLAGISTVKEIKNNPVDVKATGRLNKLYVALLQDNPDWATEERRHALNQFMARLIFCFFAEDTGIFREGQFTATIAQFTEAGAGRSDDDWGNTHEVLAELFRAMDVRPQDRKAAKVKSWADVFPYVNGGLFTRDVAAPRFSRIARSYLLRAGELDWRAINPDIFGSMIQAVADDGERGELGMHYTSVPNILKVLNPLFLDGLRGALEAAGDNRRKLINLRRRLGTIRVFDPACGSGNFLVIAYKEMRGLEAEVVRRLGGEANLKLDERRSVIPLSNFYGIEIKGFAAEIARLALLIAEFQADCRYLSQQEARAMVLPLHKTGQITVGNALRVDWLKVCPPVSKAVVAEYDLAGPTGRLALDENGLDATAEAETYICGNPPYQGSVNQSASQKTDMASVFSGYLKTYKDLDYVASWFVRAAEYQANVVANAAFVSTNSITQGEQVGMLWPILFSLGHSITFAHRSFPWKNNASDNAGVTCVIVGISNLDQTHAIYYGDERRSVSSITPYLTAGDPVVVEKRTTPLSNIQPMQSGNKATDDGNLILDQSERNELLQHSPETTVLLKRFVGSKELIQGGERWCLWIEDRQLPLVKMVPALLQRIDRVRQFRLASPGKQANDNASTPHRFVFSPHRESLSIAVSNVSSERRHYLPCTLFNSSTVVSNLASVIYEASLWNLAVLSSKIHLVWIATVCGKMKTDYRYSNTLGWNTFPVPKLTEQDKADLTRCAETILLAREAHFPATIADLYDPETMPADLRAAHDANDETLERIYIGRRFRNDTERLEKLFDMYSRMTADRPAAKKGKKAAA